jgi:hypothetical protein
MGWNLLGNNVRGTLTSGINSSVTAMDVTLAAGSKNYPATISADTPLYLTIASATNPMVNEIVMVTAASGANVTTMVRGQRGTSGLTWPAGSLVFVAIHAQDLNEMRTTFSSAGSVDAAAINFGTVNTGIYGTSSVISFGVAGTRIAYISSALSRFNSDVEVGKTAATATFQAVSYLDSANPHARILLRAARGTESSPTSLLSGDVIAQIQGSSWGTGTAFNAAGYIRITATENHSNTAAGTAFQFFCCANGGTSAGFALSLGNDKTVTTYGDMVTPSTARLSIGAPATDGSWSFVRSGNNLLIQRLESSAWVTKSTISA